jgi:hypothetical protein
MKTKKICLEYEMREYQSQKDGQHHIEIYEDEKIISEYVWNGDFWENEKNLFPTVDDIVIFHICGDIDEFEIRRNNAYGVEYTYYTLFDDL